MVAKLKSFTLAGENLRLRQPSVSLLIQGLQRELEVKLFERLGNKVHLTTAGEALLHDVEAILSRVEGIKERMDEIKGLKKGRVSIGGGPIPAASFLPLTVQRFKKKYPGIEVALKVQSSDRMEKELLEGELDLALLSWFPGSPVLHAEPYREEEVVVIAPPKHPLTKKRSVSLELLSKEPLIAPEKGIRTREMIEQIFARKAVPFAPLIEIGTEFGVRDAVRAAVASGLGIGFIAKCHVMGDIKAGHLSVLKVPEFNLKRTIYIVTHRNRLTSSLVKAFRDFLKSEKDQR